MLTLRQRNCRPRMELEVAASLAAHLPQDFARLVRDLDKHGRPAKADQEVPVLEIVDRVEVKGVVGWSKPWLLRWELKLVTQKVSRLFLVPKPPELLPRAK